MKGILTIAVVLLFVFVSACNNKKDAENCASPLNPNGDSELALLMRGMMKHIQAEHINVVSGKPQGEYPVEFEKIKTAQSTPTKSITDNFPKFADAYLEMLKQYQSADAAQQKSAYNNLVSSCISCHKNECPGPIKTMEKLIIN